MMRGGSVLGLSVLLLAAGCTASKLTKVASQVAAEQGVISEGQKGAIDRTSEAFRESFEDLTEEEEFYLGRAVAAEILARYPLRAEDDLSAYIRRVGRAVAAYSPRPETYQGYRFAILEDAQPNAFAAPGGFVFLTTGLLALVANEEQLAAVLAHEVAHSDDTSYGTLTRPLSLHEPEFDL
jgi:predicted Zn-dependent protease